MCEGGGRKVQSNLEINKLGRGRHDGGRDKEGEDFQRERGEIRDGRGEVQKERKRSGRKSREESMRASRDGAHHQSGSIHSFMLLTGSTWSQAATAAPLSIYIQTLPLTSAVNFVFVDLNSFISLIAGKLCHIALTEKENCWREKTTCFHILV